MWPRLASDLLWLWICVPSAVTSHVLGILVCATTPSLDSIFMGSETRHKEGQTIREG